MIFGNFNHLLAALLLISFIGNPLAAYSGPDENCIVNSTNDAGPGSLREAVACANNMAGPVMIIFQIPGNGIHTISLSSGELTVTNNETIVDGRTQGTFEPNSSIVIDGNSLSEGNIFVIQAVQVEIYGLQLQNAPRNGIWASAANNLLVEDCTIVNNGENGVSVSNSNNITINHNTIQNNGYQGFPVNAGIWVTNCTTAQVLNNSISDNEFHGITLDGSTDCMVADNMVNSGVLRKSGILLFNANNNRVEKNTTTGGVAEAGIFALTQTTNDQADFNTISQNIVSGNGYGIWLGGQGASNNSVESNAISDNNGDGVHISGNSNNNRIQWDTIFNNEGYGVNLKGGLNNRITENIMEGNEYEGINLEGSNNNIAPPTICLVTASLIAGTSLAAGTLEVFLIDQDSPCQGFELLFTGIVAEGAWEINGSFDTTLIYSATITDLNGNTSEFACSETNPVIFYFADTLSCEDNNILLDAGPGFVEYIWSTNEITRQILVNATDSYSVTATKSNGCEYSDQVSVVFGAPPNANAGGSRLLDCNTPIELDGMGSAQGPGISYLWSTSDGHILIGATSLYPTVDSAGTYQLEVTDLNTGCQSVDFAIVANDTTLIPAYAGEDIFICMLPFEMNANLPNGASGAWTFFVEGISGNVNSPDAIFSGLPLGEHIFTWELSTALCPRYSSDEVAVYFEDGPVEAADDLYFFSSDTLFANVMDNDLIQALEAIEVSVVEQRNEDVGSLEWDARGNLSFYLPEPAVVASKGLRYRIAHKGCPELYDEAEVVINLTESGSNGIPLVFTPNGDGFNDYFIIPELAEHPEKFPGNSLVVINRWGDVVFQAKPYNNDWDGTHYKTKKRLPPGTYFYIARLSIVEGIIQAERVTLIR